MNERSPLDMITELERAARRRRPFLVIGIVAIIAALITFTIYTNMLLNDERDLRKHWQKAANSNADLILEARHAFYAGNMAELNRLLVKTGKQVEQQAQNALPSAAGQPVPVPSPMGTPPAPMPSSTRAPVTPIALPKSSQSWPQRVFLQFAGAIQREQIVALNLGLRASGWQMQSASGERTGAAIGYNEVRYANDSDREAAEALATAVNEADISGKPVGATRNRLIAPGTLEVWLSN